MNRLTVAWSMCTGAMNKQVLRQPLIGEKTVKVPRAHVTEKMQAGSVAELVQLCAAADLLPASRVTHQDPPG
jgi:FixJ family two-component response regulator